MGNVGRTRRQNSDRPWPFYASTTYYYEKLARSESQCNKDPLLVNRWRYCDEWEALLRMKKDSGAHLPIVPSKNSSACYFA